MTTRKKLLADVRESELPLGAQVDVLRWLGDGKHTVAECDAYFRRLVVEVRGEDEPSAAEIEEAAMDRIMREEDAEAERELAAKAAIEHGDLSETPPPPPPADDDDGKPMSYSLFCRLVLAATQRVKAEKRTIETKQGRTIHLTGLSVIRDGMESYLTQVYGVTREQIDEMLTRMTKEQRIESIFRPRIGRIVFLPGDAPTSQRSNPDRFRQLLK